MKTKILCLDAALGKTGWAVVKDPGKKGLDGVTRGRYGVIETKQHHGLGRRLWYIKQELTKLLKREKPDVVVCEDNYYKNNMITYARLNNVKGVICATVWEATGHEPIFVFPTDARACAGFKNNKEEPYEFAKKHFQLEGKFDTINDVTDAFTLGLWYILHSKNECKETKKTSRKKSKKSKKRKTKSK